MTRRLSLLALFDFSAIGLSGLCLMHCLALPVLAALLPSLSLWTEQEWIHWAFVALAVPLAAATLARSHRLRPLPVSLRALAGAGLSALAVGAAWPDPATEVPITVAGSLMLAGAHIWNWARRANHCV